MRSAISVEEITTYAACPERERRRRLEPDVLPPMEKRYRSAVRTVLTRYYTELMGGNRMSYNEIRRLWSTFWDVPVTLISRDVTKNHKSFLQSHFTDEELMLARGIKLLNAMRDRRINGEMDVLIVDEPWTVEFDGVTIEGTFDLVAKYPKGNVWIIEWATSQREDYRYNLRHALKLQAYKNMTGKYATGLLVDLIGVSVDQLISSLRIEEELKRQVREAADIARAIQYELYHRVIGPHCRAQCPYVDSCIGVDKIVSKDKH